jgi:hypothetical protein
LNLVGTHVPIEVGPQAASQHNCVALAACGQGK